MLSRPSEACCTDEFIVIYPFLVYCLLSSRLRVEVIDGV
jgi:hypothetical protein